MRVRRLFLAIVSIAAVGLPACAQIAQQPRPAAVVKSEGRINGTVLCGDTRRPARGALLVIVALPSLDGKYPGETAGRSVTTHVGLDGTYSAEHLAPGEYGVVCIYPGYLTAFDDFSADQINSMAVADQRAAWSRQGSVVVHGAETETLDLVLVRGAAISGRVLYSDSTPAVQAYIDPQNVKNARQPEFSQGSMNENLVMRTVLTGQSMSTDDQGRFRIAGFTPGTYRVAARQSFSGAGASAGGMGMMFGAVLDPGLCPFTLGIRSARRPPRPLSSAPAMSLQGSRSPFPSTCFTTCAGASPLSPESRLRPPVSRSPIRRTRASSFTSAT